MNIIYPKKRLGQHFLVDKNVVRRIVAVADIKPQDHVLEIGPGKGALTEGLLGAGAHVIAIEADRALAAYLAAEFADAVSTGQLEIITADALKVSFLDIHKGVGSQLKAVSNLPYNISGPIMTKLISEREAFCLMVLMLQKEVAERLASAPGSKAYGILSILSQVYADIRLEFHLSPSVFFPPPKVQSTVVRLTPLTALRIPVPDPAFFRRVVTSSFSARRKTLPNSLKSLELDAAELKAAIIQCGIDPGRRGETLTLAEWGRLAIALKALSLAQAVNN